MVIRLANVPESPHEIAKAFAVGVFIGVMPGMGPVVALIAAFVFRLSKTAALIGSLTANPLTIGLIYASSYKVGQWLIGIDSPIEWKVLFSLHTGWYEELEKVVLPVVIGGLILSFMTSFVSYGLARYALTNYKNVRLRLKERKKERSIHKPHPHPH